jgi:LPXTG-motif cell wall-anchored protein
MQASLRHSVRTATAVCGVLLLLVMPISAQAHGNHDKPNKKAPQTEPQPDPTIPAGPGDIVNNDPQPDPDPKPQVPPGPGDLTAPAPTPDPCPGPCDIKDGGGGGGGIDGPGDLTSKPQEPGETPPDPNPQADPTGAPSDSSTEGSEESEAIGDAQVVQSAADASEATLAASQAPTAGSLPYTGAETWMIALLGVALLGAGAASWRVAGAAGRA